MSHVDPSEPAIIDSWHQNATPWSEAIRSRSIDSRRLVTDQAIVDAVGSLRPHRVLDIGCGEGWLARTLSGAGMDVVGFDAVPALIAEARARGPGNYQVGSYEEFAAGSLRLDSFDAAVCNFSLLGRDSVDAVLGAVARYLNDPGYVIVQTLHPLVACGDAVYRDGWREGSWRGFGPQFSRPAPWFFRTLAGWYALLRRHRFEVIDYREPTAADARAPSSVIFIGSQRGATSV